MVVGLRVLLLLLVSVACFGASTNDFFNNRVVLNGTLPTASGNLTGATVEPGEPHSFKGSLWWEWTPKFNGGVSLRASGNSTLPAVLVYTGAWPNLNLNSAPRPPHPFLQPSQVSFYAQSNVTVYIAAASYAITPPFGDSFFSVSLRTGITPPSDHFSSATPISGAEVNSITSGTSSTLEPGEIPSSRNVAGTHWWRWNVPIAQRYLILLNPQSSQAVPFNVAIYQGNSITNLTRLGFASSDANDRSARLIIDLPQGIHYIACEDPGYQIGAVLSIRPGPLNDDFDDRSILPSESVVNSGGRFTGATSEPGEPGRTNASIWWEWTAPVSGSVSFDCFAGTTAGFAPWLEIFRGTDLTNLSLATEDRTGLGIPVSAVRANAGEKFVIRVSGPYNGSGSIGLNIRPAPANDDFANSTPLSQDSNAVGQWASTFEIGEPRPIPSFGGSLWWTWTPTNSGAYSINAFQGGMTAPIYAYLGDSFTNLTAIPTTYNAPDSIRAPKTIRVTAGQQIHLQVIADPGESAVGVAVHPNPANDDFANAILITNELTSGSTLGATGEANEIQSGGLSQTVWYQWQPLTNGGYEFQLYPFEQIVQVLSLYSGDSITNLTLLERTESPLRPSFSFLADAATQYYIAIDSVSAGGGPFSFSISPGPQNDSFANRQLIPLMNEEISAFSIGATREPNEPAHDPSNPPRTAWFEWTAPATGGVYLRGWSFDRPPPRFAVYQGSVVTNLVPVQTFEQVDSNSITATRFTSFRAVAQETYQIALFDDQPNHFRFMIQQGPSHDDFANALEVALNGPVERVSLGASLEPGEPTNGVPGGTVWHHFTAPTNGTYLAHSGQVLHVYRGSTLSTLTPVESFPPSLFRVPFHATAGETVFISVNVGFPGSYTLDVIPGAPNDSFANRIPFSRLDPRPFTGDATIEPGEPVYPTNLTASVWWKWTPEVSGLHRILATSGHYAAFLGLYRGTNLAELIPAGDDFGTNSEPLMIDFAADAGTEYSIVLARQPIGDDINIDILTPAPNDNFSSPLVIPTGGSVSNEFFFASSELGEPTAYETVWFTWTAPTNGTFAFRSSGYEQPAFMKVFTGDALSNLVTIAEVGGIMNLPAVAFHAEQGATYRIVLGVERSHLPRAFHLDVAPGHPNDNFDRRAQLSGLYTVWRGETVGAISESGESSLGDFVQSYPSSLWAQWTAPESREYRFMAFAPPGLSVAVFQGDSIENLELVDTIQNASFILSATAGSTYIIRVASSPHSLQDFALQIGPPPANDSPNTATVLDGTNITVSAQNWTALPNGSSPPALWYSWTAPAHGYLTYSTSSTNIYARLAAFHTLSPTISSNLTDPFNAGPSYTNTIVVTRGVEYLIRLSSFTLSTNLTFQLRFREETVPLNIYEDALVGGDEFIFAQTNIFYSAPDALQSGPLSGTINDAWMELLFPGPGTLTFRTKMPYDGALLRVHYRDQLQLSPFQQAYPQPHDWTLRTINLRGRTNIVRWIFSSSFTSPGRLNIAWLDDIQFVPAQPPQPVLTIEPLPEDLSILALNFSLQAGRTATIDYSTNLIDWFTWTNIHATATANYSLPFSSTNAPASFFRARVIP